MTTNKTIAEEKAEASVRQRWQTDEALRAEFGGDINACLAYHRAEARGVTKNYGGLGVVRVRGKGGE